MYSADVELKTFLTYLSTISILLVNQANLQETTIPMGLVCDHFLHNQTVQCNCSINGTEEDSCLPTNYSIRIEDYALNNSSDQTLCLFVNHQPSLRLSENVNCTYNRTQNNVYIYQALFMANKEEHEGKYVTCNPINCISLEKDGQMVDLLLANNSALLISFERQPVTDQVKTQDVPPLPLILGSAGGTIGFAVAVVVLMIVGVRYQHKRAWTVRPPSKASYYNRPLQVLSTPVPRKKTPPSHPRTSMSEGRLPLSSAALKKATATTTSELTDSDDSSDDSETSATSNS